jgi:hypothetical protein
MRLLPGIHRVNHMDETCGESMMDANETRTGWMERRGFLKGGTAALVLAGFAPVALFGGKTARGAASDFTKAWFDARTGEWFYIDAGSWQSVELVEVVGSNASPRLDQFTVTFRGSPNAEIQEGTYEVAPPDGASFQLLVQPAGSDANGSYCSASFSVFKPVNRGCFG